MMVNKDKIRLLLNDVTRHIVSHDIFDSIEILHSYKTLEISIECHCGKEWSFSQGDLRDSEMEMALINEFIHSLNQPDFFERLKEHKEQGYFEASKKEQLLKQTGSPTISSLEI